LKIQTAASRTRARRQWTSSKAWPFSLAGKKIHEGTGHPELKTSTRKNQETAR